MPQGIHHLGCLREGVGRLGEVGQAQCNASAAHVATHCTWEVSYENARAVHFKGFAKPWRVFSCFGLREGRMRVRPANVTLTPNDVLSWDPERKGCVSRRLRSLGGVATYGSSGERLPRQCCRFTSLIKAEWWHHYRSGQAPPSLGEGDSWVRLGRWEKRKNGSDMAASTASRHGLVGGTRGRERMRGRGRSLGRTLRVEGQFHQEMRWNGELWTRRP